MGIDKPTAFLVVSLSFTAIMGAIYLSTYLLRNADNLPVQRVADIDAIADSTGDSVKFTQSSYPTVPAPITSEKQVNNNVADYIDHPANAENVQTKQPSDNLTEEEIWTLIEEMENKRVELHQEMEHKRKLSDLARDQGSDLDDKFQAVFNENLRERQELTKDFEQNVLNGASLDETSRTATPEELEELASRPGARSLLEALFQEKAIGKQWESQSKALAGKANALTDEYAAIYQRILAIDKSIAELKSMLP